MVIRRPLALLGALLLSAGCPAGDLEADKAEDTAGETADPLPDDTGAPDPATVPLAGVCSDDTHWGAFIVDSNEDYAYVAGSLSNGVVPAAVLTATLVSGDCTIWLRGNPFCDPTCGPGETCDFDGTCVPYPETRDLGTVTMSGLLNPVSMDPFSPGYTYFDTSLPNPPWDPGALLTLTTGGGAYAPITVYGVAPAPLVPVSMAWVIVAGEPLAIAWDAPTSLIRTQVVLTLRIDQHGTTPSSIECVFEDDGSAEVPTDTLEELMSLGVTGFPAGDLTRRTADRADIGDGCIDLEATSSRLASVAISGYTPCTRDSDCPDETSCNEALERCE